VISFDGFAANYFEKYSSSLKNFNSIQKKGISTPYMRPIFPSKTFVNHYSIVTGLFSESNGKSKEI
jgi:predicted AlkP superfamily pyrophosphatase or phosphodiesterase